MFDHRMAATLGDDSILSSTSFDVNSAGAVTDGQVYNVAGTGYTDAYGSGNTAASARAGEGYSAGLLSQGQADPWGSAGQTNLASGPGIGGAFANLLPGLFNAGAQVGVAAIQSEAIKHGILPAPRPVASAGLSTTAKVGLGAAILAGLYYAFGRKR